MSDMFNDVYPLPPSTARMRKVAQQALDSIISKVIDSTRGNISKILFEGGYEASFMDKGDATKYVICVSCQKGCPMRCTFCHLTDKGMYKNCRNLTVSEIANQVIDIIAYKKAQGKLPEGKECLVSFMSMGEPLLNTDNIIAAIRELSTLSDPRCRFDVSTVFPKGRKIPYEFAYFDVRMFYSLHSPDDSVRAKIMPLAEPIDYAFEQLRAYYELSGIKPIIHYTFIDGVNDSDAEVDGLIELMTRPEHKDFQLRILRYNPYDKDSQKESRNLLEIIEKIEEKMYVKSHRSPGYEIQAACGQFVCEIPT